MRRTYIFNQILLPLFIAIAFCTACTRTPETPAAAPPNEDVITEYLTSVEEEAGTCFAKLAETAAGSRPAEVRIAFRNTAAETLKESKSLSELLTDTDPVLLVGFISSSEKGYSEDEIHAIILETKKREFIVDLYFNYNDDYVYQVRSDSVIIDKATGKDGGAMREQIAYEFTESEEAQN